MLRHILLTLDCLAFGLPSVAQLVTLKCQHILMRKIPTKMAFKTLALSAALGVFLSSMAVPVTAIELKSQVKTASTDTDAIAVNPATNGSADKSRNRFEYQLNPGQPARDSIYVVNTGTSVQDVTLYARDAYTGPKGDFLIQDQAVEPTDVGSWVEFSSGKKIYKFSLKPMGFVTVPFNVLTPSNATPGDHIGAVIASATTKGKTLNIVRRVAVRLYARLSGQIRADLDLQNVSAKTFPNPFNPFASNQVVSYDISNTGNVELSADVSITTSGPLGLFSGTPQTVRVTNLLPGSKRTVTQAVAGAGQFVVTSTSLVVTGLLSSSSVASQQPRARVDVSSSAIPIGWIFWGSILLVIVISWRLVKKKGTKSRGRRRAFEETS
jgi:hypothetical protein